MCPTCFAAIEIGRGNAPRHPTRVTTVPGEPCLVCGENNEGIFVRIDPKIAEQFKYARRE